ncbi:MAG: hypothetical protein N3I35_13725 [Clostridia bacterium]|nr:hypothetical protein [Clostridia bacterium]
MLLLKIFGLLFIIPGCLLVLMARQVVSRFNLDRNAKVDFENEMTEKELEQYKANKAAVNIKMLGMLVALPGFIMILIAFK